jgi:hypothetical protein
VGARRTCAHCRWGGASLDLDERVKLERLRREVQELRMDNESCETGSLLGIEAEPEERFAMIDAEKADQTTMTVAWMCRLLGVDRRRFNEWRAGRGPVDAAAAGRGATAQIRGFHAASDGTYGAPRIHAPYRRVRVGPAAG